MRSLPTLLGALILGLLAAGWTLSFGDTGEKGPPIVIASRDIQPGLPITANQLRLSPWSTDASPEGIFSDLDLVVGRVARQAIFANEPVLESRLAGSAASGGLSSLISPGMRAISVRVDEVIGVAGFALPGGYVDVMVSARDGQGNPFSKIVLSRVKVVAAEQDTAGDPTQPKVVRAVTLELGPEDAEKLDLARNVGSLSLVLRNEIDMQDRASSGARLQDILSSAGAGQARSTAGDQSGPVRRPASSPRSEPTIRGASTNIFGAEEIRGTEENK